MWEKMETKTIVYDLDTSGGLMEVRPGTRRGGPDRGGSGAARWRGNPPTPEPRGLTRKCGGTKAARPAPGEALPDTGRAGRARPGLCRPPDLLPEGPGPLSPRRARGEGRWVRIRAAPQSPLCLCVHVQQIQALLAPPKSEDGEKKSRRPEKEPRRSGRATNHDSCDSCKEGGDLLCCDHCPAAFHLQCW